MRDIQRGSLLVCLIVYAVLAGARARADRPMVDEAWFGSPALNLLQHGAMGTSILESKGTFYEGIDRYTYWIMPIYPVAVAAWSAVTGFSLMAMRALSIGFGCALVAAWYVIAGRLTKDTAAGLGTAALLTLDFVCIRGGAMGRMDIMCAALGWLGIAAYLVLRERSITRAFTVGHALVALSVFTHPNGVLYFAGLMAIAAMQDLRRYRWWHLISGAAPYLALLSAWGMYIAHDPAMFTRQFGGNASGRLGGLRAPLAALAHELQAKYLAGGGGQAGFRVALLIPYVVGVAGAVSIRELRQHKGVRTLLVLTAVFFVYNWLLEGGKIYLYLVHMAPLYVALFAIVMRWAWVERPRWRIAETLVVAGLAAIQLAGTAYTVVRDSYDTVYLPTVAAVRQHASPGDLVMGSAELAFGLGFDSGLVDDVRLGFFSGKRPDVVVLDRRYKETIGGFAQAERGAFEHVHKLLSDYSRVFAQADCEVLVRRRSAAGGGA